jgi:hypothetical protein
LVEPDARRTIGLIAADRQPFQPLSRNLMMMSRPISEVSLPRTPAPT